MKACKGVDEVPDLLQIPSILPPPAQPFQDLPGSQKVSTETMQSLLPEEHSQQSASEPPGKADHPTGT